MHPTNRIRKILTAVSIVLVAAALIGAAARNPTKEMPSTPVAAGTVPAAMIAEPTGEYENGLPVYRLPSIAVTVSRSEALARIAREESLAAK